MFLLEVTGALKENKIAYALVGGFAVALHGAARGTIDIDLIIPIKKKSFEQTAKALTSLGLQSRLPVTASQVFDFRKEYIENKNLVAWNFYHPQDPSKLVDIIITHDLTQMKKKRIEVQKKTVYILDQNDLIKMKQQSGRPQDLEDVKALKKLQ